jgi:flagellar protein FliO/FliZ
MFSCRKIVALLGVLIAVGGAFAADPPPPLDGENVIYPRNAPASGRITPRVDDGVSLWGTLAVVAILAGGGFFLLKRGRLGARTAGVLNQRLAIEETRALGNKQFLAVATYGERRLLLAVCPGKIDLLCRLDDGVGAPAAVPPTSRTAGLA